MSNRTVAIIPARGGSKRIPRKNIREFCGKPMIGWSIEAARKSGAFDEVIVSTDNEQIADVARRFGATVPFLRPAEMSGDTSPLMAVLRLHLDALAREGHAMEFAFCIYATAPFVTPARLSDAVRTLRESDADFILGVTPFEYPVQRSLRLDAAGRLAFAEPQFALSHSQMLEPRYHDAGQFFGGRTAAVMAYDSTLLATCLPLQVPRDEAVDIDTPEDWRFAEKLFAIQNRKPPRTVFKVMGGPAMGMGHILRSLELAAALPLSGIEVAGFVCNDDARSREFITAAGYPLWSDARDFPIALIDQQADVLLIDHPGELHDVCVRSRLARPGLFIAALDCFEMERADCDLIIDLFNHHPTLKAPLSPAVKFAEGPAYAIIRAEFDTWRAKPRTIPPRVKEILVTFGGADPQRHTLLILSALQGALSLHVVIGPNFTHRAEVEQLAGAAGAQVYKNVQEIAALMHSCDLAFAGGGTTMLELMSLGTPAIIIPQSDAEARFAASMEACGAVKTFLPATGAKGLRQIIEPLIDDQETRMRMSAAGRQLVDGHGKRRIADLLAHSVALSNPSHA